MEYTVNTVETSGPGGIFFGANPPPPQPTVIGSVVLIVALIVAVIVGWWNWREAHEEVSTDRPEDLLASFEEAYAAGEIDEDEIKRLRSLSLSKAARPSRQVDDDVKPIRIEGDEMEESLANQRTKPPIPQMQPKQEGEGERK